MMLMLMIGTKNLLLAIEGDDKLNKHVWMNLNNFHNFITRVMSPEKSFCFAMDNLNACHNLMRMKYITISSEPQIGPVTVQSNVFFNTIHSVFLDDFPFLNNPVGFMLELDCHEIYSSIIIKKITLKNTNFS